MTKPFRPLLAHTVEDTSAIKYPVSISCKLDGIRCIVIDGVAYSRSLKPIRNRYVQACIGKPEYNNLDGELIVGDPYAKDCYRVTNSGVMSEDGEPDFLFHVFDRIGMDAPFRERFNSIKALPRVKVVPHVTVHDEGALLQIESEWLARGAEGVMIRSPDGAYKQGRSTGKEGILGKLKRMESSEAEILGVIELERNMNEATINALGHTERSTHRENKVAGGLMGALRVRCLETNVEFNIGTGFDAEMRKDFWCNRDAYVGRIVTYNHFRIGRKDLPRFPSYRGFRSQEDMS
jgi:DNA ligase-1